MVRFQFVKSILEIILIVTCFIGIIMLGGEWILEGRFFDLNNTIVSVQSRYTVTNQMIKRTNKKINRISLVQKQYRPATPLLNELIRAIPDKVALTGLNIDLSDKTATIVGFAPTREELSKLQSQLKKISWVNEVEVPVSQLAKKDNINFSLALTIK